MRSAAQTAEWMRQGPSLVGSARPGRATEFHPRYVARNGCDRLVGGNHGRLRVRRDARGRRGWLMLAEPARDIGDSQQVIAPPRSAGSAIDAGLPELISVLVEKGPPVRWPGRIIGLDPLPARLRRGPESAARCWVSCAFLVTLRFLVAAMSSCDRSVARASFLSSVRPPQPSPGVAGPTRRRGRRSCEPDRVRDGDHGRHRRRRRCRSHRAAIGLASGGRWSAAIVRRVAVSPLTWIDRGRADDCIRRARQRSDEG